MEDLAGATVMHGKAVAVIAANMRRLYDRKEAFRIYHSSTNYISSVKSSSGSNDRHQQTQQRSECQQ
jgi:hypothetical protein